MERMEPSSRCGDNKLNGFLTEIKDAGFCIQTRPITEEYDLDAKPFARGKFATVRRCRHRTTGRELAAKCMRKRRRIDVRHEIVHEALVLAAATKCSRIVNLHDVYETPTEMVLLLEMVPGGELQRVIDDELQFPEREAARLMKQILEGLLHLHDKNIAHLDLKPQNLLLTGGFPECNVKLCDFGISRVIEDGVEIREINGTPDYVAPEVLQYEPISLATDMWSVGVLAYVLLSGHTPFGGDSKQETFCNITNGHLDFPPYLFGKVSPHAKDFIRSLLKMNPRERPTARETLQHPWLSEDDTIFANSGSEVSLILNPVSSIQQNGQHHASSEDESENDDSSEEDSDEPEHHVLPKTTLVQVREPIIVQETIISKAELTPPLKKPCQGLPTLELSIVPAEAVQEETENSTSGLTVPLATPTAPEPDRACLVRDRGERVVPVLLEIDNRSSVVSPSSTGLHRRTLGKAPRLSDMVVELKEELALTKRLLFSDDLLLDERMGVVY